MKKRKVFLKDIIAQSPEKEYGQLYADIMLELSQETLVECLEVVVSRLIPCVSSRTF